MDPIYPHIDRLVHLNIYAGRAETGIQLAQIQRTDKNCQNPPAIEAKI